MTFSIGRIKIKLHFLFFIMLAYMFSADAGRLYLTALFYASLHECGHIVTLLRRYGGEISVTVGLAGMSLDHGGDIRLSLSDDAVIAFSGPFVNAVLAVLFFIIHAACPDDEFVRTSLILNAGLTFFNFMPVIPLDGGRFLYCVMCKFTDESKAYNVISVLGAVCIAICFILCIAAHFSIQLIVVTLYVAGMYIYRLLKDKKP